MKEIAILELVEEVVNALENNEVIDVGNNNNTNNNNNNFFYSLKRKRFYKVIYILYIDYLHLTWQRSQGLPSIHVAN